MLIDNIEYKIQKRDIEKGKTMKRMRRNKQDNDITTHTRFKNWNIYTEKTISYTNNVFKENNIFFVEQQI